MDYFNNVFTTFLGLDIGSCIDYLYDYHYSSQISLKILIFG